MLEVRSRHPSRALAEQYNPLATSPDLISAHDLLDRVVDKAFGALRPLTTERERQTLLFTAYDNLTAGLLNTEKPKRRRSTDNHEVPVGIATGATQEPKR